VAAKVEESAEITSFYFEPADGGPILAAEPGQYIGMKLILDGEEIAVTTRCRPWRQRPVPHQRQARTGGRASNHLHDQLHVGASIQLFPPSGEFTLTASDKPLVLISGGVGITPTLAMLEAALQTERPVHFIHCARNGSVHAFRDWIDGLAARHPQLKRFIATPKMTASARRRTRSGC
jgi:nitric oxide dioxygenase